jgi:hypothetical protein
MERPADALAVLTLRPVTGVDGLLLATELEAALNGAAAAEHRFATLMRRGDADPACHARPIAIGCFCGSSSG